MAGQHLIGWGLPSLRRAVAVQWDSKVPPTDENDPWRWRYAKNYVDIMRQTLPKIKGGAPAPPGDPPLQIYKYKDLTGFDIQSRHLMIYIMFSSM